MEAGGGQVDGETTRVIATSILHQLLNGPCRGESHQVGEEMHSGRTHTRGTIL